MVKYSTCRDCPARQKPCPPFDFTLTRMLGAVLPLHTPPHDRHTTAGISLVVSLATRGPHCEKPAQSVGKS